MPPGAKKCASDHPVVILIRDDRARDHDAAQQRYPGQPSPRGLIP